jgi:hypothetical protein
MDDSPPAPLSSGAPAGESRRRWRERVLLGAVLLVIAWFYLWTIDPEGTMVAFTRQSGDYYALLTRGFMRGHLSLEVPADPFLATLKNPWDPAQRAGHGMHDATYYRGRYFLYFGVTPALILFLPLRLLTGMFINQDLAVALFAWAGVAASIWLLAAVRRRYFPTASAWVMLGGALALGLANMVPALLRRPGVWEVPIACGFACFMLALAALFQALQAQRSALWAAWSSLLLGLAVGARPIYLLACAAWVLPLGMWAQEAGGWGACWRVAAWRRRLLAVMLPAGLIGVGLAVYNYERFGSLLEFGQRYQMSGDNATKLTLFDWRYLWYSFRLYVLAPAGWGPFFPFVQIIHIPPAPPGQLGVEDPYGMLPNMPFVLVALGLLTVTGRRRPGLDGRLGIFCGATLVATVCTMGMMMSFGGVTNRYMVDFVPAFVLLACLGWLAVTTRSWFRGWRQMALGSTLALLLVFSLIFNVLVSVEHNNLLAALHPAVYERLAHCFNQLPFLIDRLTGRNYGPVELKVVFPDKATGKVEPLVATGRSFLSDYLFVHYLGPDSLRFGFEHTSRGVIIGQPVKIAPGAIHTLRIDMGSLYPPAAYPWFDRMTPAQARRLQRTLRVTLDGQVVLNRFANFYDATSRQPSIGTADERPGYSRPFSGKILAWRILADSPPPAEETQYGPVQMVLTFPTFTSPRSEPLLCSGQTGRGDLVYIRYVDERHVLFGHDHWGAGATASPAVEIDPNAVQGLEIDCGVLYPQPPEPGWSGAANRDRCIIRLNGRVVWDAPADFYPATPDEVEIGANAIGASSAGPAFSGGIVRISRLPASLQAER